MMSGGENIATTSRNNNNGTDTCQFHTGSLALSSTTSAAEEVATTSSHSHHSEPPTTPPPSACSSSADSSPLHRIPLEAHKLTILIVWFTIAVTSDWVVLAYVHDLVEWRALPDPMFFLPQQEWAAPVGDWMVSLSTTSLCLLLIFHRYRLLLLRRLLFLVALLNTLRSAMILLTRFPPSFDDISTKCLPKANETERSWLLIAERIWLQAKQIGLQNGDKILCGDQFFSGHTAMMILCAHSVDYYVPKHLWLLRYMPKLFALVGIPCMLISRGHYTCDVLIGYFMSTTFFTVYHSLCELDSRKARQRSLLRHTFLMAMLVHWLEQKMPMGKIHNELNCPLVDQCSLLKSCKSRWREWRRRRRSQRGVRATSDCGTNNNSPKPMYGAINTMSTTATRGTNTEEQQQPRNNNNNNSDNIFVVNVP